VKANRGTGAGYSRGAAALRARRFVKIVDGRSAWVFTTNMNAATEVVAAKLHSLLPAGMGRLMFGTVKVTGSVRTFDVIADDDHVAIHVHGGSRLEHETMKGMTYREMAAQIVKVANEEVVAPVGQFGVHR
jgi:hypothetical protein